MKEEKKKTNEEEQIIEPDHIVEANKKVSEFVKDALAIEIFDAFQKYKAERDSGVILLSWNNLSKANKDCWRAVVKPFCDRLKVVTEQSRSWRRVAERLEREKQQLQARLKAEIERADKAEELIYEAKSD